MKKLVVFQHFNLLVLTFRRESVRPGFPCRACLAVSPARTRPPTLSSPTLCAGVWAAAGGWRARWAGMQLRCSPAHLEEPSPGRCLCLRLRQGRLPGLTFHCEKECSGRNGVATWTGAPFPRQVQAALPSSNPPRVLDLSPGNAVALCSADANSPTGHTRLLTPGALGAAGKPGS